MTLSILEQAAAHAAYLRTGPLRKASALLGYSPNTIKKYVLQEGTDVHEQVRVSKVLSTDQRLIGLYVGLWMGDGTQYVDGTSYTIKFCCHITQKRLAKIIQKTVEELFGVVPHLCVEKNHNRQYVKFQSKFVYNWITRYTAFTSKKKTHTVRLHSKQFSEDFLDGCLLGLVLSDGYLKKTFAFNVVSLELARNVFDMLVELGLTPRTYIHDRTKWGWSDLHMVSLRVADTRILEQYLDNIVKKLGADSFSALKYNEPARI